MTATQANNQGWGPGTVCVVFDGLCGSLLSVLSHLKHYFREGVPGAIWSHPYPLAVVPVTPQSVDSQGNPESQTLRETPLRIRKTQVAGFTRGLYPEVGDWC